VVETITAVTATAVVIVTTIAVTATAVTAVTAAATAIVAIAIATAVRAVVAAVRAIVAAVRAVVAAVRAVVAAVRAVVAAVRAIVAAVRAVVAAVRAVVSMCGTCGVRSITLFDTKTSLLTSIIGSTLLTRCIRCSTLLTAQHPGEERCNIEGCWSPSGVLILSFQLMHLTHHRRRYFHVQLHTLLRGHLGRWGGVHNWPIVEIGPGKVAIGIISPSWENSMAESSSNGVGSSLAPDTSRSRSWIIGKLEERERLLGLSG
jgi:hypothetical protein